MKARLPQGMGKGPSNNMNQMLKQAQQMQDKITDLQADLEQREFTGTAGGGVVQVVINGKRNVLKLDIKPEVVDPIVLSEGPYPDAGCHNEKSTANASFP